MSRKESCKHGVYLQYNCKHCKEENPIIDFGDEDDFEDTDNEYEHLDDINSEY